MSEFSSIANLEIRPTGMDAARREIERELGDIEVGVSGASNRPTGRQPRDPSTGQFMSQRGAEQRLVELGSDAEMLIALAEQRNDLLADVGEGGGPGTGSTAAMIEIQRRTLSAQQASADADDVTNELLVDIRDILDDDFAGGGGGGGGGGFGLGFASRGILGGVAGGVGGAAGMMGLLSAARLGGGAFSPGIFGQGSAGRPGEVGPGESPAMQQLADAITQFTGIQQTEAGQQPGPRGAFEEIVGFFSGLNVPEGGTTDRRENVEPEQQDVVRQFDMETAVSVDALGLDDRQVRSIIDTELKRFEQRLRQQFGDETGPRTTSRGGGATGGRFRT